MNRFLHGIWNLIKHPVSTLLLGSVVSIGGSSYYYHASLADAVTNATERGFDEGLKQGQEREIRSFQSNLPGLVDKQCHDTLQTKHDLGYAEGDKDGYARGLREGLDRGEADGHARGLEDGRKATAADFSRCPDATTGWTNYATAVDAAGKRASSLKDNPDLQEQFIAAVRTIIADAKALNGAYHSKAEAFDSTVDEIAKALEAGDYESVRTLTMTLRGTLPVKKGLFFAHEADIDRASGELSKVVIP